MKVLHTTGRVLCASSLMLVLASAQALSGRSVWPSDESKVKTGMTMDEVRQTLGQPSYSVQYGNEPGPTWTYTVSGTDNPRAVFEVDFSTDGTVASVDQRTLPITSSGIH